MEGKLSLLRPVEIIVKLFIVLEDMVLFVAYAVFALQHIIEKGLANGMAGLFELDMYVSDFIVYILLCIGKECVDIPILLNQYLFL